MYRLSIAVACFAFATAAQDTTGQRGVRTQPPKTATSNGSYYALVIGINTYPDLPHLVTAAPDAQSVAQLLSASYGFKTKILLDADATRSHILDALEEYGRTLKPDDNLLIYYAGHGNLEKLAEKAYWLPYDAKHDSKTNWILSDELTTDIKVLPARHILIISDSCYAGALTRDAGVEIRPADHARYIEKNLASTSRNIMASGGIEPVADGGGSGHSVFAAALLRGLAGIEEDSFTAHDLYQEYVVQRVGGSSDQLPEYNAVRNSGHEGGDFVFARSGAAATAVPPVAVAPDANTRSVSGAGVSRTPTRSINIPNSSFEDGAQPLNVGAGPFSNVLGGSKLPIGGALPNWGAAGTTANASAGAWAPSPKMRWQVGNSVGYIYVFGPGTAWLSQPISATLQSDTTYTLSAIIAPVPTFPHLSYYLQLWAGSTLLASTPTFQGATDFDSRPDSLTFSSGPNHPQAGQPLQITIVSIGSPTGSSGVFIDNLALTASDSAKSGGK